MIFIAVGAFVALFAAFVILPTVIQKRHHERAQNEELAAAGDG
jgi:hypothetical protein